MNKVALNECVSVIDQILNFLIATGPSSGVSGTAQLNADMGNLRANTADLINTGGAAALLAACFADATAAGAVLERMSSARASIDAIPTASPTASLLVDTAVIYALSSESQIIGATTYTARDTVEALLAQMAGEFDTAIQDAADRNDSGSYLALIALNAAVTQYLVTTEQPLPILTTYTFNESMPSLVLAQRLYADPTRADELLMQNHTVNPAFMQASGVCLSA